ncbi:helix-turn-helix domain-containing protein [Thiotrichales bacterium 19S9-12]|nr:helix-turn-helix domain-containing protein [Thiotrichales bacterium 19S9-11]MCF6811722.1 helix-turn-helix domain-containing protein [Thiotrichales bacterium 19S9-12]
MKDKSLLEVIHGSVKSMHELGIVDGQTMHQFDESCLTKIEKLSPEEIKAMRLKNKVSQAVFAKLLNASSSTVQKWETGEKKPTGISLKLLNLVKYKGIGILYL